MLVGHCFNAGWPIGVIQSQGVSDTTRCKKCLRWRCYVPIPRHDRSGNGQGRELRYWMGLPFSQPMQSLLGRICGTSRPTEAHAPQKSVRGGDNGDEDDGKLSKARDNLNGGGTECMGQSLQRQVLRPVGTSLLANVRHKVVHNWHRVRCHS